MQWSAEIPSRYMLFCMSRTCSHLAKFWYNLYWYMIETPSKVFQVGACPWHERATGYGCPHRQFHSAYWTNLCISPRTYVRLNVEIFKKIPNSYILWNLYRPCTGRPNSGRNNLLWQMTLGRDKWLPAGTNGKNDSRPGQMTTGRDKPGQMTLPAGTNVSRWLSRR